MCRIEIVNHLTELPPRVKLSIIVELEDGVTTAHTLLYRFPEPEADDPENPTFEIMVLKKFAIETAAFERAWRQIEDLGGLALDDYEGPATRDDCPYSTIMFSGEFGWHAFEGYDLAGAPAPYSTIFELIGGLVGPTSDEGLRAIQRGRNDLPAWDPRRSITART